MSDRDFIAPPPGVDMDAVQKRLAEQAPAPAERPEIRFLPTTPGMPLGVSGSAAPVLEQPADEPEPPTNSQPVIRPWSLTLPDAAVATVTGPTLLGRNPSGERALLAVPDPTRSVSKTHALLEPDPAGLWLTDLGSTNGTALVDGASVTTLVPHERTLLRGAAIVRLGELVVRLERR